MAQNDAVEDHLAGLEQRLRRLEDIEEILRLLRMKYLLIRQ